MRTYAASSGKLTEIRKTTMIYLAVFLALFLLMNAVTVHAGDNFSDVPADAWYHSAVVSAVELGLVNGTTPTTYSPDRNISHFEVYKLAACMHQLSTEGAVALQSGQDDWYTTYLDYALTNGILDAKIGYAYYERIGDEEATRGMFMNIFSNTLSSQNLSAINAVADGAIPDITPDYIFNDAVYKLYRAGVLRGVDDQGSANVDALISRAEVAVIMTRMMDENERLRFTMNHTDETGSASTVEYADGTKVEITMEDGGTIVLQMDKVAAPISVDNFLKLVEEGFYDGLTFHRIVSGFVIQGGDPDGTGSGGPGYGIKGEFIANGWENYLSHTRGVLSMARSYDMDSAGSQFFIVLQDATFLDGEYAAFGKVIEGMDVVDVIAAVRTDDDMPIEPVVMKTVRIVAE